MHTERLGCEIVEMNIQANHVHLLVNKVSPEVSISKLIGTVKEKFKQFSI